METTPKTLTPAERVTLSNQYRILEKLYPDEAEHYAALREIVDGGYSIEYGDLFNNIYTEMPFEECEYVYDVLDMFRVLITSFNALTDKAGLTPTDVNFDGFDGNNEGKRFGFARHLQKEGKWTETLVGGLNSHSQSTIYRYRKMLEKFRRISETLNKTAVGGWDLSAEQIREIIS
jgi:uncharacterized protein YfbU (UPF0304 family)